MKTSRALIVAAIAVAAEGSYRLGKVAEPLGVNLCGMPVEIWLWILAGVLATLAPAPSRNGAGRLC
jgi:hypothetical protein